MERVFYICPIRLISRSGAREILLLPLALLRAWPPKEGLSFFSSSSWSTSSLDDKPSGGLIPWAVAPLRWLYLALSESFSLCPSFSLRKYWVFCSLALSLKSWESPRAMYSCATGLPSPPFDLISLMSKLDNSAMPSGCRIGLRPPDLTTKSRCYCRFIMVCFLSFFIS